MLVTGGAGYVGSVAVAELLARGLRVRVLDALFHGGTPSLLQVWSNPNFEFIRADIRDPAARAKAVEGVRAIVHLAAIVGDPACARDPALAQEVNLDATRALLDEAERAGVEQFILASTCSNYGKSSGDGFVDENFELAPVSVYAETKVAAEGEVLSSSRGLATTCLRFATVFGTSPRMRFDLTVNEFTRDIAVANELVVYGEQFWRPYVHVRDAGRAIADVLAAPTSGTGEVFNVGDTRENYRKIDLVELLRERFPTGSVSFVHRDEDPRDYRVSFGRFAERFGFSAERSVANGIDEVVDLLASGLVADPFSPAYRN